MGVFRLRIGPGRPDSPLALARRPRPHWLDVALNLRGE